MKEVEEEKKILQDEIEKILNDDKYDQQAESAGCIDLKLSNKKKAQAIIAEIKSPIKSKLPKEINTI